MSNRQSGPVTGCLLWRGKIPILSFLPSHPDADRVGLLTQLATPEPAFEHREALVPRFLEGMSYEDMARAAGCPMGTVRSRLQHALDLQGFTP